MNELDAQTMAGGVLLIFNTEAIQKPGGVITGPRTAVFPGGGN
jgi:hypothetical protein